MPLYDVEGRGTIWAKDPQEALTLAHGAQSGELKVQEEGQNTWKIEAGGRAFKVTQRGDSK